MFCIQTRGFFVTRTTGKHIDALEQNDQWDRPKTTISTSHWLYTTRIQPIKTENNTQNIPIFVPCVNPVCVRLCFCMYCVCFFSHAFPPPHTHALCGGPCTVVYIQRYCTVRGDVGAAYLIPDRLPPGRAPLFLSISPSKWTWQMAVSPKPLTTNLIMQKTIQ
jgi:hypothetical protein